MSVGLSPASASMLSAASACSWICERFAMTPRSVVSAAPTTATDFCFMLLPSGLEERQRDGVGLLLEHHLERHVELQRLGRLRAAHDVGHHARPFVELDHCDRIGRRKTGRGSLMDDVAVKLRAPARPEHRDLERRALGAEWARWKIDV